MPDGFLVGTIHTSVACDKINVVRFDCPFDQIFFAKTSDDIVGNILCDIPDNFKFNKDVCSILQI